MFARLGSAALVLAALVAAASAVAEPIGSHWELTPFGGFTVFDSKLRFPGSDQRVRDDLNVGGRLNYETKSWLGLELAAGMTPTTEDVVANARNFDYTHASASLTVSPGRGRWGNPYAFAGGAWNQLKPASGEGVQTGGIEFGGGIKMWLTDGVGLRFEARDHSFRPLIATTGSTNFHTLSVGAGLTLALGATPRDTDGDGVPDRKDKCPGTPTGATVDATGCPHDSDGDGVLDGLDKCPGTPRGATVDATGCPHDADGDGVWDGIDTCPDTPAGARVDSHGCPIDSDGDGVWDGLDKCPETPRGAKIDSVGCPIDSDGDGVYDGLDQCPDTPKSLKVDSVGCAIEIIQRETELLDTGKIRLENINFETGKAGILAESYPTLDAVAAVLSRWPQLRLEIGGHTDSRGSAGGNLKLSQARADTVRSYLATRGLGGAQFTVKGYGATRPVVPNTSPETMARNRRVEFVVLNKDVLKKEVERRHLLQINEAAPADTTQKHP